MNLLRELTIKNLKLNKRRTIITILGIILSVALMVTVTTMVSSIKETIRDSVIKENGNYHVRIYRANGYQEKIKDHDDIESYYIINELGYSKIDSANDYKPYIKLLSFKSEDFENNEISVTEGRLPETPDEIVIGEHIIHNGKIDIKIGDKINLNLSDRIVNGQNIFGDYIYGEETLEEKFSKKYTIVGITKRPNQSIESFQDPGYTAITIPDKETEHFINQSIYYRVKKNVDIYQHISSTHGEDWENLDQNYNLLRIEGYDKEDNFLKMLYLVAVVILAIILLTSVVVIKNSFSISTVEKTKQYGILKSLGASNAQIRRDIYFEGFVLGFIGIILDLILGIIVNKILVTVMNAYLSEMFEGFKFGSKISLEGIAVAVFASLFTIFISSYLISRRVKKFSAIESIKSNNYINIGKKIKTPKYIERLFGVSGLISHKNFKRDKKKYRTTTISVTLIVIIFIALFSASSYLKKTMDMQYGSVNFNIEHSEYYSDMTQLKEDLETSKKTAKNVLTDEEYLITKTAEFEIDDIYINKNILEFFSMYGQYRQLVILSDKDFDKLLRDNKLGPENKHLVINNQVIKDKNDNVKEHKTFENLNIRITLNPYLENLIYEGMDETEKNNILDQTKNLKAHTIDIKLSEIDNPPLGYMHYNMGQISIFVKESDYSEGIFASGTNLFINSKNDKKTVENIEKFLESEKKDNYMLNNISDMIRQMNSMIMIMNIFSYGFIIVISLIALTSTFNTITSNIILRKREFATLRSVGMTDGNLKEMMRLESLFLGIKSLIFGIPIGLGLSYLIYSLIKGVVAFSYFIPFTSIIISVLVVFVILYLIMHYAITRVDKLNIVETIKNENMWKLGLPYLVN